MVVIGFLTLYYSLTCKYRKQNRIPQLKTFKTLFPILFIYSSKIVVDASVINKNFQQRHKL